MSDPRQYQRSAAGWGSSPWNAQGAAGHALLASEARVDSQRIRTGKLIESDGPSSPRPAGVLADANIHIDDTPAVSVLELRAKCGRLYAKYEESDQPVRLIMVDYLQLMRGERAHTIVASSRSANLALVEGPRKELGIPVLALSQLNRSLESDLTNGR